MYLLVLEHHHQVICQRRRQRQRQIPTFLACTAGNWV
jgi:hypothetical protein